MPALGRQPTNSPMTLNSSASSSCMTMGLNSGFFGWRTISSWDQLPKSSYVFLLVYVLMEESERDASWHVFYSAYSY